MCLTAKALDQFELDALRSHHSALEIGSDPPQRSRRVPALVLQQPDNGRDRGFSVHTEIVSAYPESALEEVGNGLGWHGFTLSSSHLP